MLNLIGEYEVSMDSKCRVALPAGLRKQLPEGENMVFYVNRSLDQKCINFYTHSEWSKIISQLSALSSFNPKVDKLKRLLMAGSARLEADSAGRVLIPKSLAESIGLNKELVIVCQINKAEIWDKGEYSKYLNENSADLAELANELFGNDLGI